MDGSLRVSRMAPMKIAAALVVSGALAIGLVACGSGSGSSTSASSAPKRNFSLTKGVHLIIYNRDPAKTTVLICTDGVSCHVPATLGVNDSVQERSLSHDVTGTIRYADGYTVSFRSSNPTVGPPWIEVTPPSGSPAYAGQAPYTFRLSEGEWALSPIGQTGGYRFKGERGNDTSDFKEMALTAYANGANAPCSYPNTLYPNSLPSSAC